MNIKIQDYVKDYCKTYSINYDYYFSYYNEELDGGKYVDFEIDGKVNMKLIEYASMVLGLSTSDIIEQNEDAFMHWYDKFSFFKYKSKYDYEFIKSYYGKGYDEARMLEVIFEQPVAKPKKYNYKSVFERMKELLKEIDKYIPGTYHDNASIQKLTISTDNLFHYKNMKQMMKGYFELIDRFEYLFFKGIKEDLQNEEINEYNFLVSVLHVRDSAIRTTGIYYYLLKALRDEYSKEGFTDLLAYVSFNHNSTFEPWRCCEFLLNKDLVQKFSDYHPFFKSRLKEFSKDILQFHCFFTWSDAKPIQHEDDEYMIGTPYYIPLDQRAKEPTSIYVPKSKEEMNGDDEFVSLLQKLAGPPSLGGIVKREVSIPNGLDVQRLKARFQKNITIFKIEDCDDPSCYVLRQSEEGK